LQIVFKYLPIFINDKPSLYLVVFDHLNNNFFSASLLFLLSEWFKILHINVKRSQVTLTSDNHV